MAVASPERSPVIRRSATYSAIARFWPSDSDAAMGAMGPLVRARNTPSGLSRRRVARSGARVSGWSWQEAQVRSNTADGLARFPGWAWA